MDSNDKKSTKDLVKNFNKNLLELVTQLAVIVPDSEIAKNVSNMKFAMSSSPKKIIELFVINVLKYKPQIDEGDENFFLNKDYDDIAQMDKDNTRRIFEFKDIWKKLTPENKQTVIQYMQCLCAHAQTYFMMKPRKQEKLSC